MSPLCCLPKTCSAFAYASSWAISALSFALTLLAVPLVCKCPESEEDRRRMTHSCPDFPPAACSLRPFLELSCQSKRHIYLLSLNLESRGLEFVAGCFSSIITRLHVMGRWKDTSVERFPSFGTGFRFTTREVSGSGTDLVRRGVLSPFRAVLAHRHLR